MSNRAYELVRSIVERFGGSMVYERKGYRHGAWVIKIGTKSKIIEAGGNRSFPELDGLHIPRIKNPKHWDDYLNELVPNAEEILLAMLDVSGKQDKCSPEKNTNELLQIIERSKWKFAWTYARTYPHEYTTKKTCSPEDHAYLIDCIEQFGVKENFGNSYHKYLYFDERKYWHMGNPQSENPEEWPDVINRTWVDVRRHAENVRHVWTAEEVELQMRLWEIQLEKSSKYQKTDKT